MQDRTNVQLYSQQNWSTRVGRKWMSWLHHKSTDRRNAWTKTCSSQTTHDSQGNYGTRHLLSSVCTNPDNCLETSCLHRIFSISSTQTWKRFANTQTEQLPRHFSLRHDQNSSTWRRTSLQWQQRYCWNHTNLIPFRLTFWSSSDQRWHHNYDTQCVCSQRHVADQPTSHGCHIRVKKSALSMVMYA